MSEMNPNLNIFLYAGAQFIHGLCGGIFNLGGSLLHQLYVSPE